MVKFRLFRLDAALCILLFKLLVVYSGAAATALDSSAFAAGLGCWI